MENFYNDLIIINLYQSHTINFIRSLDSEVENCNLILNGDRTLYIKVCLASDFPLEIEK